MPAPTTAVLDAFTRTEKPLNPGGAEATWGAMRGEDTGETNGSVLLLVNGGSTKKHSAKHKATGAISGRQEVFLDVVTTATVWVELWLCASGATEGTLNGYAFEFEAGNFKIFKCVNGAKAQLATVAGTLANGDKLWFERDTSNNLRGYKKTGAGEWTELLTANDSTFTSGEIGWATRATSGSWELDNFGGGAVAVASKPAKQETEKGAAITPVKVTGTNLNALTSSELPTGLSLTKVSETEWEITGTPSGAAELKTVTLKPRSAQSGGEDLTFEWKVLAAAGGAPVMTKPSNKAYSKAVAITPFTLTATNSPTEFKQIGLPTGLTLTGATGEISGTPTAVATTYTVEVWAKNGSGESAHVTFTIELTAKPKLTKPADQISTKGTPITPFTVTAEGAALTFSFQAAKPAPTGISINGSTGEVTGTPSGAAEAAHVVKIEVVSANGGSDIVSIEWTVNSAGEAAAKVTKPANQTSTEGTAIAPLAVVGERMTTLTAEALPAGLSLVKTSVTEWKVEGTPSTGKAITTVTLKVKNTEGAGEEVTFSWTIKFAAATFVKPADQSTKVGSSVSLAVTGTKLNSLASPGLPTGLSLVKVSETEWTITGTPTVVKASTSYTLEAKNSEGTGENKTFNWTISAGGSGTFKPRSGLSGTVRVSAVSGPDGVTMTASMTSGSPYTPVNANELWLLQNLFPTTVEEV